MCARFVWAGQRYYKYFNPQIFFDFFSIFLKNRTSFVHLQCFPCDGAGKRLNGDVLVLTALILVGKHVGRRGLAR